VIKGPLHVPAPRTALGQKLSGSFRHGTVKTRELLLMMYRTASVAAKTNVLSILAMVALALTVGPHAFAQQPSTNPPVPSAQAAPEPNAGQAQQAAPAETVQNGQQQQVQVIFSPWARYCAKGLTEQSSEIRAKEVCFTAADGHLTSGQKLVIALLIEPEGGDTKLLRVTLPLGVALVPGARIVIDEKEAMTAPYVVCLPKNGCMADFKADADLIAKLKKGRSLAIQAFDRGRPISFTLPLTGFAKSYDGPASDPSGLKELEEGLPNELQSHSQVHLDTPGGK
jgi:invasion protein IalB